MELDKRIKDIGTIQTILRYDVNCIGSKGYFFDEFIQTKDLSKCRYGELIDITTHDDRNDLCFKAEYEEGLVGFYRFFIPEDDLKPIEKKYRPYTLAEWVDQHEIGEVIHFRNKDYKQKFYAMYVGYVIDNGEDIQDTRTTGRIMLMTWAYSLENLFEDYEIEMNGEWLPFGVLDDGDME